MAFVNSRDSADMTSLLKAFSQGDERAREELMSISVRATARSGAALHARRALHRHHAEYRHWSTKPMAGW